MHAGQMKYLLARRLRYSLHGQGLAPFVTVYIHHYKILLVIQAYAYEKIVSELCMCVESWYSQAGAFQFSSCSQGEAPLSPCPAPRTGREPRRQEPEERKTEKP